VLPPSFALLAGGVGLVVAQETPSFDIGSLINYGALGLIVIAFLTDRIHTKNSMDRMIADRDRAAQQRDAIIKMQHEQVIPLLEGINARLVPMMERVARIMEERQ
jgi:hypothetical protein